MNMKNKVVVISGASRGLGRKTALHLAKEGADLVLLSRTSSLLHELKSEITDNCGKEPKIAVTDITSENDVFRLAGELEKEYTHVDVLINNAGIGIYKTVEDTGCTEMRRQFGVNFFGAFYCTKALLPLLKKSRAGYVLFVSSLLSCIPFASTCVYSATKAAINAFSEGLGTELRGSGIKAGTILPGPVSTGFHADGSGIKVPDFMMLSTDDVAEKIIRMVRGRKKRIIMYPRTGFLMKLKRAVK